MLGRQGGRSGRGMLRVSLHRAEYSRQSDTCGLCVRKFRKALGLRVEESLLAVVLGYPYQEAKRPRRIAGVFCRAQESTCQCALEGYLFLRLLPFVDRSGTTVTGMAPDGVAATASEASSSERLWLVWSCWMMLMQLDTVQ